MLFREVSVVQYDGDCAQEFGRVRVEMRRQGMEVPSVDLLIASVALVYDLTLVTHNTAHFENIPGLRLDDWLTP
jgi:predicted nucleic acid-binding protein